MILRSQPDSNDFLGKKRESSIKKSKVREIFTPSRPVKVIDLLLGRDSHIRRLIEVLNTPGQHALLYGDRGVGKSSLANVIRVLVEMHDYFKDEFVFLKSCTSEDTFESIFFDPLKAIGIDTSIYEKSSSKTEKGAAKINALMASADVESVKEVSEKYKTDFTISFIGQKLKNVQGLLIIDEADSISCDKEKKKIAELIKFLSDNGSDFKIMVVGIAETGSELVAGHKSVERCLGQVKLERLGEKELYDIVNVGQDKIEGHRIKFDGDVIQAIVKVSNGYPYFTHLLALKCAEEAIVRGKTSIRMDDLTTATNLAAESAESALNNIYLSAIRSSSIHGDFYRVILLAAARMKTHEFKAKELRDEICKISGNQISQKRLSNFYSSLITESNTSILRRVGKGIYCFNDPRFPSFIRIANGDFQ